MKTDSIAEIGIDEDRKLYVTARNETFPLIWRALMEVDWDARRQRLYWARPRGFLQAPFGRGPLPELSYLDQYVRIVTAVEEEYGVRLRLVPDTRWINIDPRLKEAISQADGR
jgi:hypothetical protein